MQEFSILHAQLFCKPKTAGKKIVYWFFLSLEKKGEKRNCGKLNAGR